MKFRPDKTLSTVMIVYAILLTLPIPFLLFSQSPIILMLFAISPVAMLMIAFFKIERIEINNNMLTKTFFFGLFSKTVDLKDITRYDKKVIDMYHYKNPLLLIGLVSKNKRYLIFRRIIVSTKKSGKLKIDENVMSTEDFNKLCSKIKSWKVKKSKNSTQPMTILHQIEKSVHNTIESTKNRTP